MSELLEKPKRQQIVPEDGKKFPLADLVEQLGDEIREAQRRAQAKTPHLLKLKECTAELGVQWTLDADGGVEFWVVELGGEVTKENTHTVSVTLEPESGPIDLEVAPS
jgi:hypothetical protein